MISNCGSDEKGNLHGGIAGDQTGNEWRIRSWYDRAWKCILRHPNPIIREMIASDARDAAINDNIGYDQYQRLSFWNELKKVGYNPADIKTLCEADCSSGVAAICKGVGFKTDDAKLQNIPETLYTGNMRAALRSVGFEVLTDAKYLISDNHLLPGDILLNDDHHVAVNLDAGSEIIRKESNNVNILLSTIKMGSRGTETKNLQILLYANGYNCGTADGIFGVRTDAALRNYQRKTGLTVDGICGKKTWTQILTK